MLGPAVPEPWALRGLYKVGWLPLAWGEAHATRGLTMRHPPLLHIAAPQFPLSVCRWRPDLSGGALLRKPTDRAAAARKLHHLQDVI